MARAAQSASPWASDARQAGLRAASGTIQVEIKTSGVSAEGLGLAIEQLGGSLSGTGARDTLAQAWIPAADLETVSEWPGVVSVRAPSRFTATNGQHTTEGDYQVNGPAWRELGFGGQDVRIGIIDLGFDGWQALVDYEWGNTVVVENFVDGEDDAQVDAGTKHGTACLEVITDIATDSDIYLAKIETRVDLEEAVDWMIENNVDIISSSISMHNVGPGDGTGWFEDIVAQARAAGIIWFTAAGNSRERHWAGVTSVDSQGLQRFAPDGQNVNWFGPGEGSAYLLPAGETFSVFARWSDWSAPVDQDYDVILLRWNGSEWDALLDSGDQDGGVDIQNGASGDEPTEVAVGHTSGDDAVYGFAIARATGSASVNLDVFADLPLDRAVFDRSIDSTAAAPSVVAVGAVSYVTGYYTDYSGQGPTNGPGGIATGGGLKPDLTSWTNVSTATYGPGYSAGAFNGTSAATPHAAGAAALLLSLHPDWSPNQIEQYLVQHAFDLGSVGPDNNYGSGLITLGTPPGGTDSMGPEVGIPEVYLPSGGTVAQTKKPISVVYRFTATDFSGIAATQLQQSVNGWSGPYAKVTLANATATSISLKMKPSTTTVRALRCSATDGAGNWSDWDHAYPWRLLALQDGNVSIAKAGTWKKKSASKYYGGTVRYATAAGAAQQVSGYMGAAAVVLSKGPDMGIVDVYVDGERRWTMDLYASTAAPRKVVWSVDFDDVDPESHTITLVVTGAKNNASTSTRVEFDAFLVIAIQN